MIAPFPIRAHKTKFGVIMSQMFCSNFKLGPSLARHSLTNRTRFWRPLLFIELLSCQRSCFRRFKHRILGAPPVNCICVILGIVGRQTETELCQRALLIYNLSDRSSKVPLVMHTRTKAGQRHNPRGLDKEQVGESEAWVQQALQSWTGGVPGAVPVHEQVGIRTLPLAKDEWVERRTRHPETAAREILAICLYESRATYCPTCTAYVVPATQAARSAEP